MSYTSDHNADDRDAAQDGASAGRSAHPGAASLQEKAATNAGATGDKVPGMDLAASPLGTDEEAGGDTAAKGPTQSPAAPSTTDPERSNAVRPAASWIWIVAAVAAAAILGFGLYAVLG